MNFINFISQRQSIPSSLFSASNLGVGRTAAAVEIGENATTSWLWLLFVKWEMTHSSCI